MSGDAGAGAAAPAQQWYPPAPVEQPAPSLRQELKRRRVFRAMIGVIAAFAVLQIIEPVMHGLDWRDEVLSYVVAALAGRGAGAGLVLRAAPTGGRRRRVLLRARVQQPAAWPGALRLQRDAAEADRRLHARLQTAFEDRQNGIDVLNEGGMFPAAVTTLTEARNRISEAQHSDDATQRRALLHQAITKVGEARAIVATTS